MLSTPFASPARHFEGSQNYFFEQRAHAVPHTIGIHVTHRDFNPSFQFTAGTPAKPLTLSIDSVHLHVTHTLPQGGDSFLVEVFAAPPLTAATATCSPAGAIARYALRQTPWSLSEPQKLPGYTYQQYCQTMHGTYSVVAPPTLPPTRSVVIAVPTQLQTLDALYDTLNVQLEEHHIDMRFSDAGLRRVDSLSPESASEHYRFRWWESPQPPAASFGRDCLGMTSAWLDCPPNAQASPQFYPVPLHVEFPVIRDLFVVLDDHGQSRSADLTSVVPSVNLHRDVIARIALPSANLDNVIATVANGLLHSDTRTFAPGDQNRPLTQLTCRFVDAFGNQVHPRSFTMTIRCATL